MNKLRFLTLGFNALSVVLAAGMLLVSFVSCGKGNENDDDDGSETITANGVSFDVVKVEGGTFTMGATAEQDDNADEDEKPTHQVTLSDFSIGTTEVTQALWLAVMGGWPDAMYNPDYEDEEGDGYGRGNNYPMYFVSWEDITGTDSSAVGYTINGVTYYQNGFCYKLSKLAGGGKQFRLPTEAEWEYAARGGKKATNQTKYSGSDSIDEVVWYWENSNGDNGNIYGSHEVGKKKPNALGLYDMSGNVVEWCSDWYGEYSSENQTNPTGGPADESDEWRVLRGGFWYGNAWSCRVSCRGFYFFDLRSDENGFRLAL